MELIKEVKKFGAGAHVCVPKYLIGKKVTFFVSDDEKKEFLPDLQEVEDVNETKNTDSEGSQDVSERNLQW